MDKILNFLQLFDININISFQIIFKNKNKNLSPYANHLFIVIKGKAIRRVIVEIDKMNKIPAMKSSKIVKILSKSY